MLKSQRLKFSTCKLKLENLGLLPKSKPELLIKLKLTKLTFSKLTLSNLKLKKLTISGQEEKCTKDSGLEINSSPMDQFQLQKWPQPIKNIKKKKLEKLQLLPEMITQLNPETLISKRKLLVTKTAELLVTKTEEEQWNMPNNKHIFKENPQLSNNIDKILINLTYIQFKNIFMKFNNFYSF